MADIKEFDVVILGSGQGGKLVARKLRVPDEPDGEAGQ
jgi:hypothetical protein